MNIQQFACMKRFLLLFLIPLFLGVKPAIAQQKDNTFEISKNLEIFNALIKQLELFYVDTFNVEKTVTTGINAMLKGIDPYTEYIPEQDMDYLKMITTGEYAGIGSIIRQRDKGVVILEPFPNSPTVEAGLKAGDFFLMIDTVDVSNMTTDKVSALLKGTPNSKLKIVVKRPGEKKPLEFEVLRKAITTDQVPYYGVRENGIGYIYLSSFTDKSAIEVKKAFEDLKNNHGIQSLILDLRGNGGGVLESAVQIVNLFTPKGQEVVSTKSKMTQWDRIYRTTSEPIDTEIPIVVLINGGTASSAEIVSGALQDFDRAVLIGERSFGKGLVQSTRDLPYDGKLKVTISRYYIPSGRCIQQLDYSHRNEDGSVSAVPDSLTNIYYTSKGRPVRDGGGIRPDIEIEEQKQPTLIYYMMLDMDYIVFDFINDWVRKHPTIAQPEDFALTDEDYAEFCAFAKEKNFTYDRQSARVLKSMKEIAEIEGFWQEGDSVLLQQLEKKFTPNLERDLERYSKEIKMVLSSEILKRYYFQRGSLIQTLKDDKVLDKAIEVLSNKELYSKSLALPNAEKKAVVASQTKQKE